MDRSDDEIRRDLIRHGEAISAIVTDAGNTKDQLRVLQNGIERDRVVREIKDEHLNERLDDIEKSIGALNRIGWWILTTFGASFIVALSSFVYGGGLKLAHP